MLKFPLWFLLILVAYSTPATAACNLFMADMAALVECVKAQEYAISAQARETALLRKEFEYLKESQEYDRRKIDRLDTQVKDLQLEVIRLGGWKTKPAKK